MDAEDIKGLQRTAEALATNALGNFRDARQTEQALRDELDEIARLKKEALTWTGHAHLGFDTRWTGYLDQRRATLNMKLAQNLAQQAPLQQAAIQALARQEALSHLQEQARRDERQQRQRRAEQTFTDLSLLRGPHSG